MATAHRRRASKRRQRGPTSRASRAISRWPLTLVAARRAQVTEPHRDVFRCWIGLRSPSYAEEGELGRLVREGPLGPPNAVSRCEAPTGFSA